MQTSKFFTAEAIFDNVTAITGLAGEKCFLVQGREKDAFFRRKDGGIANIAYSRDMIFRKQ